MKHLGTPTSVFRLNEGSILDPLWALFGIVFTMFFEMVPGAHKKRSEGLPGLLGTISAPFWKPVWTILGFNGIHNFVANYCTSATFELPRGIKDNTLSQALFSRGAKAATLKSTFAGLGASNILI